MKFSRLAESLDCDEPIGKNYMIPIQLAVGDTLISATLTLVDPTSTAIDATAGTVISSVASALIGSNKWGVSFRAQGGMAGLRYLRCRYVTALGNGDDATFILSVEQR